MSQNVRKDVDCKWKPSKQNLQKLSKYLFSETPFLDTWGKWAMMTGQWQGRDIVYIF